MSHNASEWLCSARWDITHTYITSYKTYTVAYIRNLRPPNTSVIENNRLRPISNLDLVNVLI